MSQDDSSNSPGALPFGPQPPYRAGPQGGPYATPPGQVPGAPVPGNQPGQASPPPALMSSGPLPSGVAPAAFAGPQLPPAQPLPQPGAGQPAQGMASGAAYPQALTPSPAHGAPAHQPPATQASAQAIPPVGQPPAPNPAMPMPMSPPQHTARGTAQNVAGSVNQPPPGQSGGGGTSPVQAQYQRPPLPPGAANAAPSATPAAPPQPAQPQVRTSGARYDPNAMQPIRQTPPPPRRRQSPQMLVAQWAAPEPDEDWIVSLFRGFGARTAARARASAHLTIATLTAFVGIPAVFLVCGGLLLLWSGVINASSGSDSPLLWIGRGGLALVVAVCAIFMWYLTMIILSNARDAADEWNTAKHGRSSAPQRQSQQNKYTQRPSTGQPNDVTYPPPAFAQSGQAGLAGQPFSQAGQPPDAGDGAGAQQQPAWQHTSPQPVPFQQLTPAQFDKKEPDDKLDPYPHVIELALPAGSAGRGWAIVGSSRRGFSHEHESKYREDGIALDIVDGWHLVAVADGGGAYTLARVGANFAVQKALDAMKTQVAGNKGRGFSSRAKTQLVPREIARRAILNGFRAAYDAVQAEANKRHESVKQLRATLLLLAHKQEPSGRHIVAGGQIGDGIIVGRDARGHLAWFGKPDTGPTGNEVLFLQDVDPAEWPQRVIVDESWSGPGCHFLVMTDGVADDFLPIDENLERLEKPLFESVLAGKTPTEAAPALTELLGYQRAASFDDRTLVCIYELGGRQ